LIPAALSALLPSNGYSSISPTTSTRCTSISCLTPYLPPLSTMLSVDGLLHLIGAPQSSTVLLGQDFVLLLSNPLFSINIITPLAHPALYIKHSCCPDGAPLLPRNSAYCLGNSFLMHCDLISHIQHFTYPKLSHLTLEFNLAKVPGPNHLQIERAPPASFHYW
jgi:hypothetical protein